MAGVAVERSRACGEQPHSALVQINTADRPSESVLKRDFSSVSEQLEQVETASASDNFQNALFDLLRGSGARERKSAEVDVRKLLWMLEAQGLMHSDPRLADIFDFLANYQLTRGRLNSIDSNVDMSYDDDDEFYHHVEQIHDVMSRPLWLPRTHFVECVNTSIDMIQRAFKRELVIPEFQSFSKRIGTIFESCRANESGEVTDWNGVLNRASPNSWAAAVCTTDGQRCMFGDVETPFVLQSIFKPIAYALACEKNGTEAVHKYVGQESSGGSQADITLDPYRRAHNPMVNAGGLAIVSQLSPQDCMADRFDEMETKMKALAGGGFVGFDNVHFLSERDNCNRNRAISHYMNENKSFPPNTSLQSTLDLYLQMCSVTMTVESLSVLGAVLANGGICPLDGRRLLSTEVVRDTLSIMLTCGMNDYSGEFAFTFGLPAKSSISGCLLIVVPNVMGLALYSPALDTNQISARSLSFAKALVETFALHNYESSECCDKVELRGQGEYQCNQTSETYALLFAARAGKMEAVMAYALAHDNLDVHDYDGRTPLHLAAVENHIDVVAFLVDKCDADPNPVDRWGNTPAQEARAAGHESVVGVLEEAIARRPKTAAINQYMSSAPTPSHLLDIFATSAQISAAVVEEMTSPGQSPEKPAQASTETQSRDSSGKSSEKPAKTSSKKNKRRGKKKAEAASVTLLPGQQRADFSASTVVTLSSCLSVTTSQLSSGSNST